RRYGVGGAYSESFGASAQGYFINENVLGTGRRLEATVDASEHRSLLELAFGDPYARPEAVRRTVTASVRDNARLTEDSSRLEAELRSVRLEYAYRSAEFQSVAFGAELRRTTLDAGTSPSEQLAEWIARNGERTEEGTGTELDDVDLLFRWRRDTR